MKRLVSFIQLFSEYKVISTDLCKSDKLEQRNSNYVQLINEFKSKFKMGVHLCQINMRINQITVVLVMLLSRN